MTVFYFREALVEEENVLNYIERVKPFFHQEKCEITRRFIRTRYRIIIIIIFMRF